MHKIKKEKISSLRKLIQSLAEAKETVKYNSDYNRYYNWLSSREEGLFGRFKLQLKECSKQPLMEGMYLFKKNILDKLFYAAFISGRFVWNTGGGVNPLISYVWERKKPLSLKKYESDEYDYLTAKEIL